MTNPYSMGAYPQANYYNQAYEQPQRRNSGIGSVAAMTTLGGVVGGTAGYCKNKYPVDKNGQASDTFARAAFERHVDKNLSGDGKKFFKQINTVLKKLDKTKDVESLKKLLKDNKLVFDATGVSLDTYISSLNSDNFKESKNVLKSQIEQRNMTNYQTFKNLTEKCWDKETKSFVKPDGVDSKIFDIIKKTKSTGQWKKALKYGGITAGVMGALTIGYKMLISQSR